MRGPRSGRSGQAERRVVWTRGEAGPGAAVPEEAGWAWVGCQSGRGRGAAVTGRPRAESSCEIISHFIWLNRAISVRSADFCR